MSHKIKIKAQRIQIIHDTREEELISENLFVQFDNRTVIGIYPHSYDLTEHCDGQDQTFAGTPAKGLIYKCYTIKTIFSSKTTIKYNEIPDWSLMSLDKDKTEGELSDLIALIRNKPGYLADIEEKDFLILLSNAIKNMIPKDRMKVEFSFRTH